MKSKAIPKTIVIMLAVLCLSSCRNRTSDSIAEPTAFSLGSLYEDNPSKLRFSVKKDEADLIRERISERWRMDFIMKAEPRSGTDSLY